jgi:hypothetical protein
MTLTVALALVAGLVLVALVAHSVWSARRANPRRADDETAARVEPGLGGDAAPVDRFSAEPDLPELRLPPLGLRRIAKVDALIDAVATLSLEAPVTGELALQQLPPTRRAGTKAFHVEALNGETGEWETPAPGRRYAEFQAGVQLANRTGALNEIEYSEFVQKVQAFAEGIGAMADFPDMLDVVARARELDNFAGPHDAHLSMKLVANAAAWSVGYIQQAASRHGFVPGSLPGRLVLPSADEGAPPVLVLAFDSQAALAEDPNDAALRHVTISLDVPQTPETAEPFAAWQQAARALATDMDATLMDDAGRPITLHHFTAIAAELQKLYRALEARDVAAGSAAARRLFS